MAETPREIMMYLVSIYRDILSAGQHISHNGANGPLNEWDILHAKYSGEFDGIWRTLRYFDVYLGSGHSTPYDDVRGFMIENNLDFKRPPLT